MTDRIRQRQIVLAGLQALEQFVKTYETKIPVGAVISGEGARVVATATMRGEYEMPSHAEIVSLRHDIERLGVSVGSPAAIGIKIPAPSDIERKLRSLVKGSANRILFSELATGLHLWLQERQNG